VVALPGRWSLGGELAAAADDLGGAALGAQVAGGGEGVGRGDVRVGEDGGRVAGRAGGEEVGDAVEADGEPAGGDVAAESAADELVVAAAAGQGAAGPGGGDLEDLAGVVAHAADQGRVELPAQRPGLEQILCFACVAATWIVGAVCRTGSPRPARTAGRAA